MDLDPSLHRAQSRGERREEKRVCVENTDNRGEESARIENRGENRGANARIEGKLSLLRAL